MVSFLKDYISRSLDAKGYLGTQLREVDRELQKLDIRDFEPSVRVGFLTQRGIISTMIQYDIRQEAAVEALRELLKVLDGYRGEGSRAVMRTFDFITDAGLRRIIERDYAELKLKVFPEQAWKSSVILAGSILEAILDDILSSANRMAQTNASHAAKRANGLIQDRKWGLADLINVAAELGVLPSERAGTVDQVLRDYRNFVHPRKEIRSAHECTEAEAYMAVGALDGVCNHLANHVST